MNLLFDKIEVTADGVKFIPFRKATLKESFLAYTHNTFNQDKWEFTPTSFKEFLKMLEKTKMNDNLDYTTFISLPGRAETVSFDDTLQSFASNIYTYKRFSEAELKDFYTKAYKIKQEAEDTKNLFKTQPGDLID